MVYSSYNSLDSFVWTFLSLCDPVPALSADDVLDAEEDFDDELGDGGHDYADLAAAMGSPEEEEESTSDEEEDGESGSELEAGDHDMFSDGEEEGVGLDDDDSSDAGGSHMSDSDLDESGVSEELNPFELAEATDSEDEQKLKGTCC